MTNQDDNINYKLNIYNHLHKNQAKDVHEILKISCPWKWQTLLFWTYNQVFFLLSQICSKLSRKWQKIIAQIYPRRVQNRLLQICIKNLFVLLQICNSSMLEWLENLKDFFLDMFFKFCFKDFWSSTWCYFVRHIIMIPQEVTMWNWNLNVVPYFSRLCLGGLRRCLHDCLYEYS